MGRGDQIRRASKKSLKAMRMVLYSSTGKPVFTTCRQSGGCHGRPSPDPATDPEQSMQDGLLRSKLSGELIVPCMVMDSLCRRKRRAQASLGQSLCQVQDETCCVDSRVRVDIGRQVTLQQPSKTVDGHQDGHQEPRDVIHPWSWNMPANDPQSAPCGGNASDWADDGQGSHNGQ